MTVKEFATAVRRHWRTFVITFLAVLTAALLAIYLRPVQYVSNVGLMVSISGSTTTAAYQNDTVVAGRVNTYLALLTTEVVAQRVVDRMALGMSARELADEVSAARVPPNTSIIDVTVRDSQSGRVRRMAEVYAEEFIAYAAAVETPTGADGHKVHVTVVNPAGEPDSDLVQRALLAVLAVFGALVLGAVAVWARVRTATRSTDSAPNQAVG